MPKINYACTGDINGDWCAIDVTADYQPPEKQTWFEPGCPADLIITSIRYIDTCSGQYEYLDETQWEPELLEHLVSEGFKFLKRRQQNEELEMALFRAA
jgi:hypothetical protein